MPELVSQHKDDILIVQFTSQKILSDVLIAQIGRELLELADEANGKMVLDFQGVTFVKLCNIAPSIMEVFEITRLNKVFSIFDSVDEALKSFQKKGWFG